jgi:hypothetical protein
MFALIIMMLLSTPAVAQEWRLLEPKEVAIEAYQYRGIRDTYLAPTDKELDIGGHFIVDADLIRRGGYGLWMENRLHFDQSGRTGHIKHAGWYYRFMLTLYATAEGEEKVSLFHEHHSRHILEETRDTPFPVYDKYGIRVVLIGQD